MSDPDWNTDDLIADGWRFVRSFNMRTNAEAHARNLNKLEIRSMYRVAHNDRVNERQWDVLAMERS